MKFAISLAAAAAGFALPALASETPPEPKVAEQPAKAKEAEKICKRVALQMGSRRLELVCMTVEEWRAQNAR